MLKYRFLNRGIIFLEDFEFKSVVLHGTLNNLFYVLYFKNIEIVSWLQV